MHQNWQTWYTNMFIFTMYVNVPFYYSTYAKLKHKFKSNASKSKPLNQDLTGYSFTQALMQNINLCTVK